MLLLERGLSHMNDIIRKRGLIQRLGISEATLWRWARTGRFPKPIQLGPNTVGWIEADVTAWIEAKKLASGEVV
jgi:prophage regulatory protein